MPGPAQAAGQRHGDASSVENQAAGSGRHRWNRNNALHSQRCAVAAPPEQVGDGATACSWALTAAQQVVLQHIHSHVAARRGREQKQQIRQSSSMQPACLGGQRGANAAEQMPWEQKLWLEQSMGQQQDHLANSSSSRSSSSSVLTGRPWC